MGINSAFHTLGVDFLSTSTTQQFALGTQVLTDQGFFVYGQANGALTVYDAAKVDDDGQLAALTTAISGAEPTAVGIAQVAFADNEYGWVWRGCGGGSGSGIKVNVLASCAADVKIYTTATAGALDDTATDLIQGLKLVSANGGSTAAVECFAATLLCTNSQD